MKKIVSLTLFAALVLTGCGIQQQTAANTTKQVQWNSLSGKEQQAILQVSKRYGDVQPKVLKVTQSVTENSDKPMYLVQLGGHFRKQQTSYTNLEFSILADGSQTWAFNLQ